MELSEIPSILNNTQEVFNQVSESYSMLQYVHSNLLTLKDQFINRQLTLPENPLLQEVSSLLDSMIGSAPMMGESHDGVARMLKQAGNELHVEHNNPEIPPVLEQLLNVRASGRAVREAVHVLNEGLPEHDNLHLQVSYALTPEEVAFLSQFRLAHDKLQLLTSNYALELDKSLNGIYVLWSLLDFFNMPQFQVYNLNDNLPVALLPVRVETRFMTTKHIRNNKMFVSVNDAFRDDSNVFATDSLNNIDRVSATMDFPAPGMLQPVAAPEVIPDDHELWVRIYPDDIEIHSHEELLTQAEINAGMLYWEEIWRAGINNINSGNLELGAWRVLVATYGPQRAAWVARQTMPTNTRPTPPTPRPAPLTPAPVYPSLTPKPAGWTEQPRTYVMPDRFVVRLYDANNPSLYREVNGLPVPSPLPVGLDPSNPYANYMNSSGTGLNMPPELRWMTDFAEAEQVGMGIRIPLLGTEKNDGFSKLLVLGIKLSMNANDSQQELERLFDNHHFKTGLAIVPQGTATNNTDDKKAGFALYEPGSEGSFAIETQAPLFTPTSNHFLKADGQRLAEALGVSNGIFQHVAHANATDVKESIAMNRALWSATMGYYVTNLLTPAALAADVANTREYFTNYVHGRGLIPAFRVGRQPYGVLPATVFSRWKPTDEFNFEGKLFKNILRPLSNFWENYFVPQVDHVTGAASDPADLVNKILGLHPASLQFHQRISGGPNLLWNLRMFIQQGGNNFNPAIHADAQSLIDVFLAGIGNNAPFVMNPNVAVMPNFQTLPRILSMTFNASHRLLNGPVIDTIKLSETRTVEKIPNGNGANYLQWLRQSPLWRIRTEDFTNIGAPAGQAPPQALLYLLLRYAWFIEHLEASLCLLKTHGAISIDAGQHYELINLVDPASGGPVIHQEHRDLLFGVVRSEVVHEHSAIIDDVMRNLASNTEYLESGMTPDEFQQHLWAQAMPQVEATAQDRFGPRLEAFQTEQSLWNFLTMPYEAVSGPRSMEEYIWENMNAGDPCLDQLMNAAEGIDLLATLPTARLERLLAEHLDTCAYRLDSWLGATVWRRIEEQRAANPTGIYLGAYSILQNVKPGPFPGIRVLWQADDANRNTWQDVVARMGARNELAETEPGESPTSPEGQYYTAIASIYQPATFIYVGDDPNTLLIEDRVTGKVFPPPILDPQGFILAPSLSHAVTGAILRAGYVAHRNTPSLPQDALAVNLTSERVRKAMFYLEGIRNGQSLNALLGYQFERGLHFALQLVGALDQYVGALREKFPLVAGTVVPTQGGQNTDAQTSHVVDGLKLIEAYRNNPSTWYAGALNPPTGPTTTEMTAIEGEIDKIMDSMDAIGDLMLSEAVFQLTKGNYDRASAVLNSLGYGNAIPEPEIINTPRQGRVLTNRCAVQLQPATATAAAWNTFSARALAEPNLNNWLSSQLPAPADIMINVYYTISNVVQPVYNVNINSLGLNPVDLVALYGTPGSDQQQDSSELSMRIKYYIRKIVLNSDNTTITIDYRGRVSMLSTQRTIFELTPVLNALVNIVNGSRMLDPADFLLGKDAIDVPANPPVGTGWSSSQLGSRINSAITGSLGLAGASSALTTALGTTTQQSPPYTQTYVDTLRNALMGAARFGVENAVPDSGVSFTDEVGKVIVAQAKRVKTEIDRRIKLVNPPAPAVNRLSNALAMPEGKAKVTELAEIAKIVFHRSFKVFADFVVYNSDVQDSLNDASLLNEAGPDTAVDEWMQGISRVRPRVGEYYKQMMLSESISHPAFFEQRVVQVPVVDPNGDDRWIGMKLPADYPIPGDVVSMVIETDWGPLAPPTCGMVIDEWTEQIPVDKITTGIAMHYDQPNNEAPQAILLATTPETKGYWAWNDLMDTLNETISMAAKRAVEPDMIQNSDLSQVLPALVVPMTGGTDTSPSLDLGRNCLVSPAGFNNPLDFVAYPTNPNDHNNLAITGNQ